MAPNDTPTAPDAQQRDWSSFFAALAAFAKEIIPLILPLFGKEPNSDTQPPRKS